MRVARNEVSNAFFYNILHLLNGSVHGIHYEIEFHYHFGFSSVLFSFIQSFSEFILIFLFEPQIQSRYLFRAICIYPGDHEVFAFFFIAQYFAFLPLPGLGLFIEVFRLPIGFSKWIGILFHQLLWVLLSDHWVVHFEREEYFSFPWSFFSFLIRWGWSPFPFSSWNQSYWLDMIALHEWWLCSSHCFIFFLFLKEGWLFFLWLHG